MKTHKKLFSVHAQTDNQVNKAQWRIRKIVLGSHIRRESPKATTPSGSEA